MAKGRLDKDERRLIRFASHLEEMTKVDRDLLQLWVDETRELVQKANVHKLITCFEDLKEQADMLIKSKYMTVQDASAKLSQIATKVLIQLRTIQKKTISTNPIALSESEEQWLMNFTDLRNPKNPINAVLRALEEEDEQLQEALRRFQN